MKIDNTLLTKRAKQGDSSAFSELYGSYAQELYRFALYLTGNSEDAEDAVQEAALSAWQSIHSLKDDSAFKQWIFKILSNKCKTLLMKRNKLPDALPVEDYDFLVSDDDEGMISSSELKEALESLTPPDAQIILLSVIGGFKSYELAGIFNMTPGAVRVRQKRALERLREIL